MSADPVAHADVRHPHRTAGRQAQPISVGVSFLVAVLPAIVLAATMAGSYLAFAVGSSSRALSIAITAAILVSFAAATFARNPQAPRLVRPSAVELGIVALWLAAVLTICHQTLRWSWFAPVTYSVDAAHHTGVVASIIEHWGLPSGFQLSGYPMGPHAAAALLASITGIAAVTAVWWTAIGSVFQTLLLVMVVTKSADRRRSWVGAPVALAIAVSAWRYTVGVVTWDHFLGMAVAVHLLLATSALLTWGGGSRGPIRTWLPSVVLLSLAIVVSYPQLAPALPLATLATLVARVARDPRRSRTHRRRLLLAGGVGLVALLAIAFAFLVSTGALAEIRRSLTVVEEGYAAHPGLGVVGGPLAVLAFVIGLLVALPDAVRLRGNAVAITTEFVSLVLVLLLLSLYRSQSGAISNYRIEKIWYALVPIGAVIGGLAVGPVVRAARAHTLSRFMAVALTVITLAVVARPFPMSPTSVPYVGPDEWRLAEWTRRHHDPKDVGLAGPGFAPYALWWGALMRPTYGDDMVEDQRIAYWSDWPGGTHGEHYLLVVGRRLIADYLERPGVVTVKSVGRAALLRRVGTEATQTASDAASGKAEQGAPGL